MLRLIIGLVLIIFSQRLLGVDPKVEEANVQTAKVDGGFDLDVVFDRIATRFGAFAIVAAISYPIVRSWMAIHSARPYALPSIELNSGSFILITSISVPMLLATIILGVSTIVPIVLCFGKMMNAARLVVSLLLGIILFSILVLYIVSMTMVMLNNSLSPALEDLSNVLQHLPVCEDKQLRGVLCERALWICHEAAGPGACSDAVGKYVDTLRPSTGRIP